MDHEREATVEQIPFTIDGREIVAQAGETILQAALRHGIYIPSMCWHPALEPIGACRVCLVKVNDDERLVASCQVPAGQGMSVDTQSAEVRTARRKALSLALVDHPLDCGMCDKSGECDLQDKTVELGCDAPLFPSVGFNKGIAQLSPLIEICNTRCITCGRCVQICQEVQGARAIDYVVHQGLKTVVGPTTDDGYPCESCGQCITVCPCGVLLDKTFKHHARSYELQRTTTVCPYCSLGCLMLANTLKNKVYRVTPSDAAWHNGANLCVLGRFGWDTAVASDSQKAALKPAADGKSASLDETVVYIGETLRSIREKYGPKSIAVFADTTFYNEDYHALQRFARETLRTPNLQLLDETGSLAARQALHEAYGVIASPASLTDVRSADAMLIVNSDMVEAFPVAALDLMTANFKQAAKLFVAGYRVNKLTRAATRHLRNNAGSDYALLLSLIKAVCANAKSDASLMEAHCQDFKKDLDRLGKYSDEQLQAITGLSRLTIEDVAGQLLDARDPLVAIAISGVNEAFDIARFQAAIYLAQLLTKPSHHSPRLMTWYNSSNVQGALDAGVYPLFGQSFSTLPQEMMGKSLDELYTAIEEEQIKAVVLLGEGLAASMAMFGYDPQTLAHAELFAVISPFASRDSELAHVTLPAASWGERSGARTSIYRQVLLSRRAACPCPATATPVDLINRLTALAGSQVAAAPAQNFLTDIDVYRAAGLFPGQPGAWDWSAVAKPAALALPRAPIAVAAPDSEFPFQVQIRRFLGDSPPLSNRAELIKSIVRDDWVQVSREDAERLGLQGGDRVRLETRTGAVVTARAFIDHELPVGVVALNEGEAWRQCCVPIDVKLWSQEGKIPSCLAKLKKAE